MLSTEWSEVEVVDLLVDLPSSLGIVLCGSKNTGVMVRSIRPTSCAHSDGRIRVGDRIMGIQHVSVRSFGPDQVASIIRNALPSSTAGTTAVTVAGSLSTLVDDLAESISSPLSSSTSLEDRQRLSTFDSPIHNLPSHEDIEPTRLRLVVARSATGDSDDLQLLYQVQQQHQQLQQDGGVMQTYPNISLIPTTSLDNYIDTLVESDVVGGLSLPLPPTAITTSAMTVSGSVEGDDVESITKLSHKTRQTSIESTAKQESLSYNEELDKEQSVVDLSTLTFPLASSESDQEQLNGKLSKMYRSDNVSAKDRLHAKCHEEVPSPSVEEIKNSGWQKQYNSMKVSDYSSGTSILENGRYKVVVVELERTDGQDLGMTVIGCIMKSPVSASRSKHGVFVRGIEMYGLAARADIKVGDQIIEVDGISIEAMNNYEAIKILRQVSQHISFTLLRKVISDHDYTFEYSVGDVTPGIEDLMRQIWQPKIGPNCEIMVFRVRKPKESTSLGFSLGGVTRQSYSPHHNSVASEAGTVEPDTGSSNNPGTSRHFVEKIIPSGFIGRLGIIQPGDEILQVNGIRIHGNSPTRAVRALRTLPINIELVIARHISLPGFMLHHHQGDDTDAQLSYPDVSLQIAASEVGSIATTARYSVANSTASSLPSSLVMNRQSSPIGSQEGLAPTTNDQSRVADWVRQAVVNNDPTTTDRSGGQTHATLPPSVRLNSLDEASNSSSYPPTSSHQQPPQQPASTSTPGRSYSSVAQLKRIHSLTSDRQQSSSPLVVVADPRYGQCRPVWSTTPLLIQLDKSSKGFGFSLSEYKELEIENVDKNNSNVKKGFSATLRRSYSERRRKQRLASDRANSLPNRHRYHSVQDAAGSIRHQSAPFQLDDSRPSSRASSPGRSTSTTSNTNIKHGLLLIDSILPNGVAECDGRLSVADRLLFVNDRNLTKASLREAQLALATLPQGPCLLGVAKVHFEPNVAPEPTPPPLQTTDLADSVATSITSRRRRSSTTSRQLLVSDHGFFEPSPQLTQSTPQWSNEHTLDYNQLPMVNPKQHLHAHDVSVAPLDPALERSFTLTLNGLQLGIKLDALAAGGQDGCLVTQLLEGGAVYDQRALAPRDYLTSIQGRSMRQLTNGQAFQNLLSATNDTASIVISYYPVELVESHREAQLAAATYAESNGIDLLIRPKRRLSWHNHQQINLYRQPGETEWGFKLMGLSFCDLHNLEYPSGLDHPTFISEVAACTPAGLCGELVQGDIVTTINQVDVSSVGPANVEQMLRQAAKSDAVRLRLGVLYSGVLLDEPEIRQRQIKAIIEQPKLTDSLLADSTSAKPTSPMTNGPLNLVPPQLPPAKPSLQAYKLNGGQLGQSSGSSYSDCQMDSPQPLSDLERRDSLSAVPSSSLTPGGGNRSPMVNGDFQTPLLSSSPASGQVERKSTSGPLTTLQGPIVSAGDSVDEADGLRCQTSPSSSSSAESSSQYESAGQLSRSSSTKRHISFHASVRDREASEDEDSVTQLQPSPSSRLATVVIRLPDPSRIKTSILSPPSKQLGIRLVGSIDPTKPATFVGGLLPGSLAADQQSEGCGLEIGDEIVKLNGHKVEGLSHLSVHRCLAQAMIDHTNFPNASRSIKLTVRRDPANRYRMVASNASPTSPQVEPVKTTASPPCPVGDDDVIQPTVLANHKLNECPYPPTASRVSTFIDDEDEPPQTIDSCQKVSSPTSTTNTPPPQLVVDPVIEQIKECLGQTGSTDDLDLFHVMINRGTTGFGIYIEDFGPNDEPGAFVSKLLPNGQAAQQGSLQPGDRIWAVNGQVEVNYDKLLLALQNATGNVSFTIGRRRKVAGEDQLDHVTSPLIVATDQQQSPDHRTSIIPGVETLIELDRRGSGLGLSIFGGIDSPQGAILVHTIHEGGAADLDGRLKVNDHILAVNKHSFVNIDCKTATKLLRNAGDHVKLTVLREPTASRDDVMESISVVLKRPTTEVVLGLSLANRSTSSVGTKIESIVKGSVADQKGVFQTGDVILEVNGRDLRLARPPEVTNLLKESVGDVKLVIGRVKRPRHIPPLRDHPVNRLCPLNIPLGPRQLDLDDPTPFGFSLRLASEAELQEAVGSLVVDSVTIPGLAHSGGVKPGYRLLGVNHEPVDWLQPDELRQLLSSQSVCVVSLGRLYTTYPTGLVTGDTAASSISHLPESFASVKSESLVNLPPNLSSPSDNVIREEGESDTGHSLLSFSSASLRSSTTTSQSPPSVKELQRAVELAKQTRTSACLPQIYLPAYNKELHNQPNPLGLWLTEGSGVSGPIAVRIRSNSPAKQAGLCVGDRLLGMNDQLLVGLAKSADQVLRVIEAFWMKQQEQAEGVCLTVLPSATSPLLASRAKPDNVGDAKIETL